MSKNYRWALPICLLAAASHAEVYKSIDADGRVTYSSTPPPAGSPGVVEEVAIDPPPSEAQRRAAEDRIKAIERESARAEKEREEKAAGSSGAVETAEQAVERARLALENTRVKREGDWQYLATGGRVLRQSYLDRVERAERNLEQAEDSLRKARRNR